MPVEWLNYHHLLYFWTVVRAGGLAQAGEELRLAPSTISVQIRRLEDRLSEKLLRKSGRRLVLTEMGRLVYGYADEIFSMGREMVEAVHGRPTGRPMRLVVGVADVVPKLVAQRLIEPALEAARAGAGRLPRGEPRAAARVALPARARRPHHRRAGGRGGEGAGLQPPPGRERGDLRRHPRARRQLSSRLPALARRPADAAADGEHGHPPQPRPVARGAADPAPRGGGVRRRGSPAASSAPRDTASS